MGRSRIVIAVVLTAWLAARVQAAVSTFQEGASGYSGTTDTVLESDQPDDNSGNQSCLYIRGSTSPRVGLIKFDNIFGAGAGQISSTVTAADVTSAILTMTNYREEVSGTTPNQSVWPFITPWEEGTETSHPEEATSTWNHRFHRMEGIYDVNGADFWGTTTPTENAGPVFGEDIIGDSATPMASVSSLNRGFGIKNVTRNEVDFDVTDAVKAWGDGTYANEGFLLGHTNSSSIDSFELWYSSEPASIADARPKLTVTLSEDDTSTMGEWTIDASGDWNSIANWTPGIVPSSNDTTAVFADAITAPRTVFTDAAVTVKNITFGDSKANTAQQSYAIVGNSQAGSVTFDSGTSVSTISALEGSHEFQVVVNLNNATTVTVGDTSASASLAFNNAINLNGNTLTKIGPGTMNINNQLNTGGGSVAAAGGVVGGSGTIGGDLTNSGAKVARGNSLGKLAVAGNYLQSDGSLEIEINGASADDVSGNRQYDQLSVGGDLTISGGSLDILMGFTPEPGDTFDILDFDSIDLSGATLNLGTLGDNLAWDTSQLTVDGSLSVLSVPEPLAVCQLGIGLLVGLWGRRRQIHTQRK